MAGRVGGDLAGHGFEGADGPDGVEVAEQQDFAGGNARAEAQLEDVAVVALAVSLDAAVEGFGMGCSDVHACIDGGFGVRWRFSADKEFGEIEELGLLASGTGQEGTHGDGIGHKLLSHREP